MRKRKVRDIKKLLWHVFLAFLPSVVLLIVLSGPKTHSVISSPLVVNADKKAPVHFLMPNTKWGHLNNCGEYFEEYEESKKVLKCALDNEIIEKDYKLERYPRCFVVTNKSPDLKFNPFLKFNYIEYKNIQLAGFYDPITKSIFLSENLDIEKIYRHEFQHYILHDLTKDDSLEESYNHTHIIWKVCEGQFYGN